MDSASAGSLVFMRRQLEVIKASKDMAEKLEEREHDRINFLRAELDKSRKALADIGRWSSTLQDHWNMVRKRKNETVLQVYTVYL